MQVGLKSAYDCIKAFFETDLTEDLQRIDVPTMIVRGDDDQIVPIDASGRRAVELVKDVTLKEYPALPTAWPRSPRPRTNSTPTCSPSSVRSRSHVDRPSLAAACHRPGRRPLPRRPLRGGQDRRRALHRVWAHPADGRGAGVVERCPTCDQVLLRLVRGPGRAWLDLHGLTYLQLAVSDEA